MTKKELEVKMKEWIDRQAGHEKEEWYGTDRQIVRGVLKAFAKFINIKLEVEDE